MSDYSIVPNAALTATADAIRTKSGSQATIEFDHNTGFKDAVDAIPSGGGNSYQLLVEDTFNVSTTSTSATQVKTISAPGAWTYEKILYVCIRRTSLPEQGVWGSDSFFVNANAFNESGPENNVAMRYTYKYNGNGTYSGHATYGLYASTVDNTGKISIYARYNASYSGAINGEFKCQVYLLPWPNNTPFVLQSQEGQ